MHCSIGACWRRGPVAHGVCILLAARSSSWISGVPREQIHWNPSIVEDACIGCGTCVTGCSRLVYRFDFERKKPVVVDPLNCMVGCTTCASARCAGRRQPAAAHRFLRCLMRGRRNRGLRHGGPAGSQNDQRARASGREGISAG
jgi:NAD-dependent dihydropyrimidine dehydrogenase PreA subunit